MCAVSTTYDQCAIIPELPTELIFHFIRDMCEALNGSPGTLDSIAVSQFILLSVPRHLFTLQKMSCFPGWSGTHTMARFYILKWRATVEETNVLYERQGRLASS